MASPSSASRCTVCGRSKTVDRADFVHVRLGLDEPPEPLLCKCKSPIDMVHTVQNKFSDAASMVSGDSTRYMNTVPPPNVNAVIIKSLSSVPLLEVELKSGPESFRRAFEKMTKGVLSGEKVVKVPVEAYKIAPGIVLAMSYELPFTGHIVRSEYKSVIVELSCDTVMSNTKVRIIARRYGLQKVQDGVHTPSFTYACEVEILEKTTHADLRRICADTISVVGSVSSMSRFVDQDVISAVRQSDHAVVNVNGISAYSGKFMLKADGVKVYVFCYLFGKVWKEAPSARCTKTYTMPNDGLVCVTPFRTLRKKQPTVDLLYG
ncbi:uncharacterized protein PpBr36_11066 [Pyricularia pennisetigena]|uniref:uncharacterized protein n=1 Tax=Pyricularia pennisetigena TaxID=1578925 RepID=UPI001154464E|nr:uncharacterized protein PpBr36_11066 [Pyricularia pennisetigena]TLS20633.1 hypothetical protein PpBr36_11066 [Pyricularia pennisetigena]